MSNIVSCPHCNHSMDVAPGATLYCEACGKQFTAYSGHPMSTPATAPPSAGDTSSKTIIIVLLACACVFMLMCGGILVALLLPAVQSAKQAAQRMQAANDLKMIALAMHNYHDVHQMLPASYIPNDDGSPRTSWRTAILPYLEQIAMYEAYDFDASWDSPENAWTASTPIDVYHSSASTEPPTTTNYFMLVGPGTIGEIREPGKSISFGDLADGLSTLR